MEVTLHESSLKALSLHSTPRITLNKDPGRVPPVSPLSSILPGVHTKSQVFAPACWCGHVGATNRMLGVIFSFFSP